MDSSSVTIVSEIPEAIEKLYEKRHKNDAPRNYLGASEIGHPCSRYLWYKFRHACGDAHTGRIYRLFETGMLEEARIISNLHDIGYDIEIISKDHKQFECSAFGGHFSGHVDGIILNHLEHKKTILECKTHNDISFHKLISAGVQESKPQHYAQVQVYMHLFHIPVSLYVAVNKNDDSIYTEVIEYDKEYAERLYKEAYKIITATEPPARREGRWCSWCSAYCLCNTTDAACPAFSPPQLSCRQCCHATPVLNPPYGLKCYWKCRKYNSEYRTEYHKPGRNCKDLLFLPGLLERYGSPIDYGQDCTGKEYIVMQGANGTWKYGPATKCHSCEDLTKIPSCLLGNG